MANHPNRKLDLTKGDFQNRALAASPAWRVGDVAILAHFTQQNHKATQWELFTYIPRADSGWQASGAWKITRLAVRSRNWEGNPDTFTAWIEPAPEGSEEISLSVLDARLNTSLGEP